MKLKTANRYAAGKLQMAIDSVRDHKFRSFLTVLGIVIGVMTAISIASMLTGMRDHRSDDRGVWH